MKSEVPNGGETRPRLRFRVITIPRCTGSMPAWAATGRIIGVIISITGRESIGPPSKIRMMFNAKRMTQGAASGAKKGNDAI